jgi:cytochrome c biogenesis protein
MRTHLRLLRAAPPPAPRHLDRLPHVVSWSTGVPAEEVTDAGAAVLRRRRYRVRFTGSGASRCICADKGRLKETGNLLFHAALVVLLAGLALGGLYGYKGQVLVVADTGFANALSSYDGFHGGRLFTPAALAPFSVRLDRFAATYQPDGTPASFDAWVTYRSSAGGHPRRYDIRVNHPLGVDGAKVYLTGHGYAPVFVVRGGNGTVAFAGPTPFLPSDPMFTSTGVVKVPDARPGQLAFSGYFFPTLGLSTRGFVSSFPAAHAPAVTLLAWRGNLGLDNGLPQSVYTLDTHGLRRVAAFLLRPGQTEKLPGGGSIRFVGLQQYAAFQVTHDPGKPVALLAAVLALIGLLLSLRARRLRAWLRTAPVAGGGGLPRSVVQVAGLARTDGDELAEEISAVVSGIQDELRAPRFDGECR